LVSAVKAIRAELRIDQLFELKDSVARIRAGVMKDWMSCRRSES